MYKPALFLSSWKDLFTSYVLPRSFVILERPVHVRAAVSTARITGTDPYRMTKKAERPFPQSQKTKRMKQFSLLLLALLFWLPTQAQTPCAEYQTLMKEADGFLKTENYGKAVRLFQAAKVCHPQAGEMIDEMIIGVFNQIENQRVQALKDRDRAEKAEQDAQTALRTARTAEQQAEAEKIKAQARAEAEKKTALANDIAYKASQLLEDGLRSEAFNLAAFAHHFIEQYNHNVTQVLSNALYCNWTEERRYDDQHLLWSGTLQGHTDAVLAVAFSPDGATALTGSSDNTAKLWEVGTGRELRTLQGHTSDVLAVAFSPDGATALTGSSDKTAKLWEVGTGRELRTLQGHTSAVRAVAFSPDGATALTGSSDKTAKLWEVGTGRELRTLQGHTSAVWAVAFSPDGATALTGSSDKTAKLWEVGTGRELRTLQGHTDAVLAVAFSPDGATALTGSSDNTAKLWEVGTGRELRTLQGHTSDVWAVAFSPDGATALTGSYDNTAKLWEVGTGRELRTLQGHTSDVLAVAFSPDGATALTGSSDKTAKLWEVGTGRELRTLQGHTSDVLAVAFSPDGATALTGSSDNTAKLWEVGTGRELRTLQGHTSAVRAVAFSPDGATALTGSSDNTAKLWEVGTGRELHTLQGHTSDVRAVAFSPDETFIYTGSDQIRVQLYSTQQLLEDTPVFGYLPPSLFNQLGLLDVLLVSGEASVVRQVGNHYLLGNVADAFVAKYRSTNNPELFGPGFQWAEACYQQAINLSDWEVYTIRLSDLYLQWSKNLLRNEDKRTAHQKAELAYRLHPSFNSLLQLAECSEDVTGVLVRESRKTNDYDLINKAADYFYEKEEWEKARQLYEKGMKEGDMDVGVLIRLDGINDSLGMTSDFNGFLNLNVTADMIKAADYFYEKEEWEKARQLYEKRMKEGDMDVGVLIRLDGINDSLGMTSDFNGFLNLNVTADMIKAADYFYEKEEWEKARQLYEKRMKEGDMDVGVLIRLDGINDSLGMTSDFNGFLNLNVTADMIKAADYFYEKEEWEKARQLYEKRMKEGDMDVGVLIRLDGINMALGNPSDFSRFLNLSYAGDLVSAANHFYEKEEWEKTFLLTEKAYSLDATSLDIIVFADVAQKTGKSIDLQQYLQEEEQIERYITSLNANRGSTNREQVASYQKIYEAIELLLSKNPQPANKATYIQYINSYGWYQLLTGDFAGAHATIERGIELDASHAYFYTNLPPALLFQGHKKAEGSFKEWGPKPFTPDLDNYPTYAHVFLSDFEEFEKEGIIPEKYRGDMEKIKKLLEGMVK